MARRVQWAQWSLPETTLGPLSVATVDIMSLFLAVYPSLSNYTIIRNIFDLSFWGEANVNRVSLFYGLIGVNAQAVGTALPTPSVDFADWLYWSRIQVPFLNDQHGVVNRHADVLGKRRQKEFDRQFLMIFRNVDATESVTFGGGGRVLLMLP